MLTWWPAIALGAITVVAIAVRFYKLDNRSLWLDEIFQAESAHLASAGQVVQFAQVNIDQMPLFFMFTWFLGHWGDNAYLLRLPSAVIGVAAVIAVYAMGSRLAGRRMAVVAAAVMAVMPYAVWYSQEARNYALLMLLTTLQMYFAFGAVTRGRVLDWAGLAVFTLLNLYNHYLALLITAGVVAFVGLAELAAALRPASRRTRVLVAILLLFAAAAAALVRWRPLLKSVYSTASATLARHPRTSLAAIAVLVLLVIGVLVYVDIRLRSAHWKHAALRQVERASAAAAAVLLGYLPWLPYLRAFLRAPNQGLGRLNASEAPHWAELIGIGPRMGWSGIVAVAFVAGVVTLAVWALRRRPLPGLLLGCWLLVPAGLLVISARWAIVDLDIRYLAGLFPGAVLITAAGVEGAVRAGELALRRLRRQPSFVRSASIATAVAILALLMVQVAPSLAASYGTPKDDWRDAAAFIKANSAPGSMAISVGNYSDWAVICLNYYFHEIDARVRLVDGMELNSDDVTTLVEGGGTVWGVVNHPSPSQLNLLTSSTDEKMSFADVTRNIFIVRAPESLSPLDQARQLLRWEVPLAPPLDAAAGMLDLVARTRTSGQNVLSEPQSGASGWTFTTGASASSGIITLRPAGSTVDATYTSSTAGSGSYEPRAGDDLLLAFDHRSDLRQGQQLVFAVTLDSQGHQLAAVPSGAGYVCPPAAGWTHSYFAFWVPAGTTGVVLFFRATGHGTADFQNVYLSRIS